MKTQCNTHPWWGLNFYFMSHDDENVVLSMLSHSHGYSTTRVCLIKTAFHHQKLWDISRDVFPTHTLNRSDCYCETWPPLTWQWEQAEIQRLMSWSLKVRIIMHDIKHKKMVVMVMLYASIWINRCICQFVHDVITWTVSVLTKVWGLLEWIRRKRAKIWRHFTLSSWAKQALESEGKTLATAWPLCKRWLSG